ncbi:hypothetical protein KFK09_001246 [Dendrobium nobile]|uniref:Uncharacterized protein n=1 Tax=Dendrobium nobile TaxID=94219 RepID=A0A8T3C7N9_DENNO|nr:hypothetical protein KFK09_001246 [Dendrobium nobile]
MKIVHGSRILREIRSFLTLRRSRCPLRNSTLKPNDEERLFIEDQSSSGVLPANECLEWNASLSLNHMKEWTVFRIWKSVSKVWNKQIEN